MAQAGPLQGMGGKFILCFSTRLATRGRNPREQRIGPVVASVTLKSGTVEALSPWCHAVIFWLNWLLDHSLSLSLPQKPQDSSAFSSFYSLCLLEGHVILDLAEGWSDPFNVRIWKKEILKGAFWLKSLLSIRCRPWNRPLSILSFRRAFHFC